MLGLAFTVFAYLPRLALILYWRFTLEFACSVKRGGVGLRVRMPGAGSLSREQAAALAGLAPAWSPLCRSSSGRR